MKTLRGTFFLLTATFILSIPSFVSGQPWQLTTSYPLSAFQVDAVEAGGRIYAAGGFNGIGLTNIYFSAANADGSLGLWSPTTALPEPDPGPGLAVNNGWVYAALGSGAIYRAQILAGGVLDTWLATATAEASTNYYGLLKAYNGYLYLFGRYDGSYHNVIRIALINADGSLGTWMLGSLPLPLFHPSVQIYNDRVYIAGGLWTGGVVTNSYSAPVRSNGELGAWRAEAALPTPLWNANSLLVEDQIFLFGGLTNSGYSSQTGAILSGTIDGGTNGIITNWTAVDTMPSEYSTAPGSVFVTGNGQAYLVGGMNGISGQFSNQVWYKALATPVITNQPPVATSQTVSVEENASVNITLSGSDPDQDALTFIVVDSPTNGTLSGTAPNLVYHPNSNFLGTDSFTFKANDGHLDSPVAIVAINVVPPTTNHPPVARIIVSPLAQFPGVTELVVISPNNSDATVVLDGSQSSDADHDSLQFTWQEGGTIIGSEAIITRQLSVGTHTITLTVSDGHTTAIDTVTVEVITAAQATGIVAKLVIDSSLSMRAKRPLMASLRAASASFNRSSMISGANQLHAFQNKVRAQVRRKDPALAQELIDAAQEIIDVVRKQ